MTTTTAKLLSLSLALALAGAVIPGLARAGTFQVTGQNGTTLDGTFTCHAQDGHWVCDSQSVVTTPQGLTGTRSRQTQGSQGSVTSTLSGTRVTGRSFARSVTISR